MKYLLLLFVFFITSCKLDSDKQIDRNKFTFKTGDDTELFFKNMRQSYYDLEENKAAKFNVFRHEDRLQTDSIPVINLAIVNNYLHDEAYLLVEPNEYLADVDPLKIALFMRPDTSSKADTVILDEYNHESMLEFSSELYEALLKNAQFKVAYEGDWQPILTSKEEREAFRITVSDYYRLTRIY